MCYLRADERGESNRVIEGVGVLAWRIILQGKLDLDDFYIIVCTIFIDLHVHLSLLNVDMAGLTSRGWRVCLSTLMGRRCLTIL